MTWKIFEKALPALTFLAMHCNSMLYLLSAPMHALVLSCPSSSSRQPLMISPNGGPMLQFTPSFHLMDRVVLFCGMALFVYRRWMESSEQYWQELGCSETMHTAGKHIQRAVFNFHLWIHGIHTALTKLWIEYWSTLSVISNARLTTRHVLLEMFGIMEDN